MGPHGHPMSETTSTDADPANRDGFHYEAVGPNVDWAAKALADAQERYREQFKDRNMNGHLWAVRKVPNG